MNNNPDLFEAAVKAILSAILDHQTQGEPDGDEGLAAMAGMGEPEGEGMRVTVGGEDKDAVEEGLEEAMGMLDKMPLEELLKGAPEDEEEDK